MVIGYLIQGVPYVEDLLWTCLLRKHILDNVSQCQIVLTRLIILKNEFEMRVDGTWVWHGNLTFYNIAVQQ